MIERFKGADKYLFSLPMWNFGIPYKLKHYIDVLVQPTYTFSFSPKEGYKGLVTRKEGRRGLRARRRLPGGKRGARRSISRRSTWS